MNRRPRIALIAYDYLPAIGGMGTYAQALAEFLQARDYDVQLVTHTRASRHGTMPVHPVLTSDLARDLPRLRRIRADLYHAVNFGYAPAAMMCRPFVLTVHGTDFLTPWVGFKMDLLPLLWRAARWLDTQAARRAIYTPALRSVDQILTCSRFSARLLRKTYPGTPPASIVPNGVDDWFLRSDDGGDSRERDPRRLLTVCKLDVANRRKNVDAVIRAMSLVGDKLDLTYDIIGDGPEREALETYAARVGVRHRVRFLGHVSRNALREAYRSASLFVLAPTVRPGDVEGFGIVYLEAAAAGTPSLASRCGGTVDAIADGVSGFFADNPGPAAIAAALERFFTGRVLFDAAAVRQHAERHAWSNVLEPIHDVYERLLSRGVKTRASMVQVSEIPQDHTSAEWDLVPPPSTARPVDWRTWIQKRPQRKPSRKVGRALFISYVFPPIGGSAVHRPAKLVKYLPQVGWSVEVLTAGHDRFDVLDASLLADVPGACRVHRLAGHEPANLARSITAFPQCVTASTDAHRHRNDAGGRHGCWLPASKWLEDRLYWRLARLSDRLGYGNGEALWTAPAVRAAVRLHREHPFDVVVSSGPPHFVHRVAWRVARETGLPWVADVRDPFVSDFDRTRPTPRATAEVHRLERLVLRDADVVVVTSPSLADLFRARYPERADESVRVVTNGFDRDDLAPLAQEHTGVAGTNDECVFVAAGAFYGRREIRRIVEPLQRVLDRNPRWQARVRLVIAGTLDRAQRAHWQQRAPEWLTLSGYLDHPAAIRLAARSTCTILVVPRCRHGMISIPGKTFELLALPAHLLALAPTGSDTARIVEAAGGATVVPFEDAERVTGAMETIIRRHHERRLSGARNYRLVDRYDRFAVAARFGEAMARAVERDSVPSCDQGRAHACVPRCEHGRSRRPADETEQGRSAPASQGHGQGGSCRRGGKAETRDGVLATN